MDAEQALVLVDHLLQGQKLKDIQEQVFRYSWSGWTYPEIAQQIGYDTGHTRDVGSKLWQQISQAVGEQVSKKNLQAVLRRQSLQKPEQGELNSWLCPPEPEATPLEIAPLNDIKSDAILPPDLQRLPPVSNNLRQHWGESIDVSVFYGRYQELSLLQRWIEQENCRLILVLGMGGMGKTTLVTKLAKEIVESDEFSAISSQLSSSTQNSKLKTQKFEFVSQLSSSTQNSKLKTQNFEFVIWQSLRNAPTIATILEHWIQILSNHREAATATHLNAQLDQLMHYLRTYRCLLVLDNFDAVLGDRAGQYRDGYEGYGELLRRVGVEQHVSHVLLTSREQPKTLVMLEGKALPIRTLRLSGLDVANVRLICEANGCCTNADSDWSGLAERYSGNPLAIKIVSTVVRDLFDGQLAPFLQQGAIAFGDIRSLLDEQFQRLSTLEQHILYWLAIHREWVSLPQLRSDLVPSPSQVTLLEAMLSLRQRSLIEQQNGRFTLQPVVMEYVTEQFLDQVSEEIRSWNLGLGDRPPLPLPTSHSHLPLLHTHILMQAQAEDYLRESQVRVLLAPLAARLVNHFQSLKVVESQFRAILSSLRTQDSTVGGYAGGNLINLLHHLGISLSGYDFSQLSIRQTCLQGANLQQTNFAGCHFLESHFTETLAVPLAVAFSPTGEYLASGDLNSEVRLWRVAGGENVLIGKGHGGWVWSIAFSPEGHLLASGSEDQTVKLWHVQTGHCVKTLAGHDSPIWSVAFSPDGQLLASSSEDWTVKLWNIQTGHCLTTLKGHQNWVRSVAFCPISGNGRGESPVLASAGDDQTIKLWNLQTGQCYRTLSGHRDRVWAVAFSPDGRWLASGSSDNQVRVWDVKTGECLRVMGGHENWVRSVAFSADGQTVISSSEDRTVRLWDWSTGTCRHILSGHTSWVRSVAAHPTLSLIATGSGDHTIKLWNGESGQCCRTLTGFTNRVWSIAPLSTSNLPDSLASGHDDYCVRLWSLKTGQCEQTLRGHTNAVCTIAASPTQSLLASGSSDRTIRLWNLATGNCLATLREHLSRVWSVAFSPDGEWLASGSDDQTVKLWHVATGQCHQTLRGHTSWVCSVAFSPISSATGLILASGSHDQRVKLWDGRTGTCLQTLEGHSNWVWTVTFSPDGQTLASGSGDHTIKLWDVKTGECYLTLQGHTSRIWSIAFSADGNWLASASTDQTVRLWDVSTGDCLQILRGHTNVLTSVAFSADGTCLISSSQDETIKLWEIATGQCLHTLKADRPYEGMNITAATGLSDAQKTSLRLLGAIET